MVYLRQPQWDGNYLLINMFLSVGFLKRLVSIFPALDVHITFKKFDMSEEKEEEEIFFGIFHRTIHWTKLKKWHENGVPFKNNDYKVSTFSPKFST